MLAVFAGLLPGRRVRTQRAPLTVTRGKSGRIGRNTPKSLQINAFRARLPYERRCGTTFLVWKM
ncbi:hypothetical protein BZL30_1976 [Mycobacterium kansasii]|uniref:Uncharacterized protein n=1 Tax=Mycobacterium kansasii TaxID=1768 RepID=A0A1V3XL37_MYCKA|nr:hypothetical protein BZL30_1976 [Mycobacterium kansasii]